MPNQGPLDEDAVRQVLARAVELEHQRGGSLTEAQVREVARELSIPSEAIDQALAEYRNGVDHPAAVPAASRVWRSRVSVRAAVGVALVGLTLAMVVIPLLFP
jgi:hypothetical protein